MKRNCTKIDAYVDSINIANPDLISIFFHSKDFKVQTVKNAQEYNDNAYHIATGGSLRNLCSNGDCWIPWNEVYIVTPLAYPQIKLPIKTHAANKLPTLEFAGLAQFNARSLALGNILSYIWYPVQSSTIRRLDIAIDFPESLPKNVESTIMKFRIADKKFIGTTYYRTSKQRDAKNPYVNIISYSKTGKDGVITADGKEVVRLEFSFRSQFLKNHKLDDYMSLLDRIKNFIFKYTGLTIVLRPLTGIGPFSSKLIQNPKYSSVEISSVSEEIVPLLKKHQQEISKTLTQKFDIFMDQLEKKQSGQKSKKRLDLSVAKYVKTSSVPLFIDIDPSFLNKKRKEGLFKEGIHYFKPDGCNLVLWDIEALGKWVMTIGDGNDSSTIIDNMFK